MLFFLEEIITEILLKLPARELCRLRCVSKSWCKLIDSPRFIKMHLNRSIQNNSNKTVVLSNNRELFYFCFDDLLDHNSIIKEGNIRPLKSGPSSKVLGSCNGLLLVCKGDNTCRQESYSSQICSGRCMKDFGIWNPNTGEYKSLPPPLPLPDDDAIVECKAFHDAEQWVEQRYGFGYDSGRDDYIVVKVNQVFVLYDTISTQVDIYSMKLKSWRRIESISLPLSIHFIQRCAVFACGVLHWATLDQDRNELSILAFDIGAEEFRFVSKPDNLPKVLYKRKDKSIMMRLLKLHELKGSLYISYFNGKSSDIWIMRDYGVKESWSKLLSTPLSQCSLNPRFPSVDHPVNRPLAYSSLGDKILLNERFGKLILCDTGGDMKKEDIQFGELGPSFVAYSCVDSLVRLSNSQYSSQEESDAKRKRRRTSFA